MTSLEGWGSAIELRPRGGSNRQVQRTGFAMVVARRPDGDLATGRQQIMPRPPRAR